LEPAFESALRTSVAASLLKTAKEYDVDVIEVVGHTDEQPIGQRTSNLDKEVFSALASPATIGGLRPTCHASNLVRDLINRIFLSGPTTAHQALSSLPQDFSDIAAQNRALANALDFVFTSSGDPRTLRVAVGDVQSINGAVERLKQDIRSVDPAWVNANSTVWGEADEVALEKSQFVHGELELLSNGTTVTQQQAATLSKHPRDQADRMEKMSTAIRIALLGSLATGASELIPREDCFSE
jgi:hypothetical protein